MNPMQTYTFETIEQLVQANPINYFSTPSFLAYVNEQKQLHNQEENEKIKFTIVIETLCIINSVIQINKVWNDVPVDHYRNYQEITSAFFDFNCFSTSLVANWFREAMSSKSFFHMLYTHAYRKGEGNVEDGIEDVKNNFNDAVRQLTELLNKGEKINPYFEVEEDGVIKRKRWRWRLMDFHDNISQIYLEQTIENVEFTQNSIKNPYKEGCWTVTQPVDKLELAKWAAKVRNCVLSRADNVISGDSEIVFIEKEGFPEYTVEIPGPRERKRNQPISIKEIQRNGERTGSTKDSNDAILKMIERAMGITQR